MELLLDPNAWLAFLTLTALEIVLGIDNIVFIAILVGRLPLEQRPRARTVGLGLAMFTRIALLLAITWVMGLTAPLFVLLGKAFSGRDLILMGGGAFLLAKSTLEIHAGLEGEEERPVASGRSAFLMVVSQIAVLDIIFSLDSVITAVGLAEHVSIMIAAIVLAVLVMMLAAGSISAFIERHPTIKMLALSFLILIGVALIGEGLDLHIPKGYIYFAMAYSVGVEMLNIRMRRRRAEPVRLRKGLVEEE